MKFANVIGLVSACQHTRNRSVKSEIDREYSDENALLQPKSLWATLHELAVQGEAEKLVALCYDMYLTANVDLCVKTAAAGEGLIKKNVWSNWGEWTSCTQTCGTGKRTRARKCLHNHSSAPCEGNQLQESTCNEFSCPFWSNWNEWLSCTKTCGGVKVLGSWLRSKTFFVFTLKLMKTRVEVRFRSCEEGRIGAAGCQANERGIGAVDAIPCGSRLGFEVWHNVNKISQSYQPVYMH